MPSLILNFKFEILNSFRRKGGFTLVELLIVVTIIAIISAIGVTIYSNVQKNARDARRKADVDAISNAMEAYKSVTGSNYTALATTMFSNGTIPVDSGNGLATYCTSAAIVAQTGVTWTNASACPTAPSGFTTVADGNPGATASWTICALLENPASVYCKSSTQQ